MSKDKRTALLQRLRSIQSLQREGPLFAPLLSDLRTMIILDLADNKGVLSPVLVEIQREFTRCFSLSEPELELYVGKGVQDTRSSWDVEREGWELMPKDGFFRDYLNYTAHTQAPILFHIFCSLVGVGAVLANRFWFEWDDIPMFPNFSLMVLGDSGVGKTLATGKIINILREVGEGFVLAPEQMTPESLLDTLVDNPTGLVYMPEFSASVGKQDYMKGMIPLITRLLDSHTAPYTRKLRKSTITITGLAPTFVLCSTPAWLKSSSPADTFQGGFWARFLTIYADSTPRREDLPQLSPVEKALRVELVKTLKYLCTTEGGEMRLDPECREYHREWYATLPTLGKDTEINPLMVPYYHRKHIFAKKLAMSIHVVECGSLNICRPCFEIACKVLLWLESFLPQLSESVLQGKAGDEVEYVMGVIRRVGGTIAHSDLLRRTHKTMDSDKVKRIVRGLWEAKQLTVADTGVRGGRVYILEEGRGKVNGRDGKGGGDGRGPQQAEM